MLTAEAVIRNTSLTLAEMVIIIQDEEGKLRHYAVAFVSCIYSGISVGFAKQEVTVSENSVALEVLLGGTEIKCLTGGDIVLMLQVVNVQGKINHQSYDVKSKNRSNF